MKNVHYQNKVGDALVDAKLQKELDSNDLAKGAQDILAKAKSGQLINPKVLGLIIAVVLIFGLWWFLANSSKNAKAAQWREYDQLQSKKQLEAFSKDSANTGSVAGKVSRLQLARIALASEGINKLTGRGEDRTKAIESIESARKELAELNTLFAGDMTIRASILDLQSKAELALVSIPTTPTGTDSRGTVEKAVAYLKEMSDVVGPTTVAGKKALEQAEMLTNKREEIITLGQTLHAQLSPAPIESGLKTPDSLGPLGSPPGLPPGIKPIEPTTLPPPMNPPETKPDVTPVTGGAGTPMNNEKKPEEKKVDDKKPEEKKPEEKKP